MPCRGPRVEDPEAIGEVTDPTFLRLPDPATAFAERRERLRALAPDHVLGEYLLFLAGIVDAQHAASQHLPPPLAEAEMDVRISGTMPPLAPDLVLSGGHFAHTLQKLLGELSLENAPEAARDALQRLASLNAPEQTRLAQAILTAAYPADQLGECLFAGAALQVLLTAHAARLPAPRLKSVGDGVCPACAGTPVASLIVGWPGASRARYLCCSLCSTMWNYVRIKCTSCSSTQHIEYLGIEKGGPRHITAETCGQCRCYIKHLNQHDSPVLEPFADDLASFALDRLVHEEGFRPGGINPLLVSP